VSSVKKKSKRNYEKITFQYCVIVGARIAKSKENKLNFRG